MYLPRTSRYPFLSRPYANEQSSAPIAPTRATPPNFALLNSAPAQLRIRTKYLSLDMQKRGDNADVGLTIFCHREQSWNCMFNSVHLTEPNNSRR